MAATRDFTKLKRRVFPAEVIISLGLFLLALVPRVYDLSRFVTADEAKWVYRSAQFLAAFVTGDWPGTSVNLTPAVTTTWLGSLGLALYYYFNQATINMPFVQWLGSIPQFRTEISVLVAARWPVAILTSLGVIVIYLLARRLFNPTLAVIAAILIALDAHTIALSRVLGHDAPVSIFLSISLLLLLLVVTRSSVQQREAAATSPSAAVDQLNTFTSDPGTASQSRSWLLFLLLSGMAAGLAILSKAPALVLIPIAALIVSGAALQSNAGLHRALLRFCLWAVVAYLTVIVFWPAAWVDPIGRPRAVLENAFLSATDQEEADSEGYWLVPDLGPFYYLVNGAFKLNPLVMVGLGLAAGLAYVAKRQAGRSAPGDPERDQSVSNTQTSPRVRLYYFHQLFSQPLLWLILFVVLFTLFMTLADKRSPRYILPVFPALALIAAFGWMKLYQAIPGQFQVLGNLKSAGKDSDQRPVHHTSPSTAFILRIVLLATLVLFASAILVPYVPYYFSYYNPLLGGAYTAPRLVKIGWGEGLDRVGRFLQRELTDSRVGTAYASTVAPYFKGNLSGVTGDKLDYVVLYTKQVQSGEPSPSFIRYFEQMGPLFSVELNGIRYADVYRGPALQPASAFPGPDKPGLPRPIAYRPLTPYGHIGQVLEVDVIWQADGAFPAYLATVSLVPMPVLDSSAGDGVHNSLETIQNAGQGEKALAAGQGRLTRVAEGLIVSHHRLMLPEELDRGLYALALDGRRLGEIELRRFDLPSRMGQVRDVVFDEQIEVIGYRFRPTEDYISVTIAWQADKPRLPNYTVFVQFVNAATNERVAGIDTQPRNGEWPTSRWAKGEVVADEYLVAMPPGLDPGFYKLIIGLYQPETGQRLVRANGRDYWALPFTFIRE